MDHFRQEKWTILGGENGLEKWTISPTGKMVHVPGARRAGAKPGWLGWSRRVATAPTADPIQPNVRHTNIYLLIPEHKLIQRSW